MLEQEIKELTAAVQENTEQLKQMNAGREESLKALLESAKDDGKPARTTRAKKTETAAAEPAASTASAPSWNPDLSVNATRSLVGDYLAQDDNPEAKKARTDSVKAVFAHFGADVFNPIESRPDAKAIEGDDNRRQAVFFITRFANGLTVDFKADYDFNADPLTQGELEPAAAEEAADEDDILA